MLFLLNCLQGFPSGDHLVRHSVISHVWLFILHACLCTISDLVCPGQKGSNPLDLAFSEMLDIKHASSEPCLRHDCCHSCESLSSFSLLAGVQFGHSERF